MNYLTELLRRPTPIHEQCRAGDERSRLRGQKDRRPGDVMRLAPASHRDLLDEGLVGSRVVQELAVHVGRERPRADGVDGDAAPGPFESPDPREIEEAGL